MGYCHPNTLAALERYRPGIRDLRQCARDACRQPATKRSRFCRLHGGAGGIASKPSPRRIAIRAARRELAHANVPLALERQEIWQAHQRGCDAPVRVALLHAWLSPDPNAWALAVARYEYGKQEHAWQKAPSKTKR